MQRHSRPRRVWRADVLVLSSTLIFSCLPALAEIPAAVAEEAARGVTLAREGRHWEGIEALTRALARAPDHRGVQADLTVVLMWAGRDREALARFARIGEGRAPVHAVTAAAVAARRTGRVHEAARLYRIALARGESDPDAVLGLALSEQALGNRAEAERLLGSLLAAHPHHSGARDALGALRRTPPIAGRVRVLAAEGRRTEAIDLGRAAPSAEQTSTAAALLDLDAPFEALSLLEARLAAVPSDSDARRLRLLVLSRLGLPGLALEEVTRDPNLLRDEERRGLEADRTAYLIRWGGEVDVREVRGPAERHALTDSAIADLDARISAWSVDPSVPPGRLRGARLDRVVALRDRHRMAEVAAEAEALAAEAPLPSYVRSALGDAYLELRRPSEAEREYRAVLTELPGDVRASTSLYYALHDQRRWAEARQVAHALERDVPVFRSFRGGPGHDIVWERVDALAIAARERLFANDMPSAKHRANELASAAPRNSGLRALRSDVARLRGHPEEALDETEVALAEEPHDLGLRLSRAEALLDLQLWREAAEETEEVLELYPENLGVRRLARRRELLGRPELQAASGFGLQRGATRPELVLDARLFSAPIAWDWRTFAGTQLRSSQTPEGAATAAVGLGGLEYRSGGLTLRAGALYEGGITGRGGIFTEATLRLSDAWFVEASATSLSQDVPLRASRNGITATGTSAGATWRQDETRQAALQLQSLRFSDANDRLIGFARWRERAWTAPDWSLDLEPYAYATRNSRERGPYFSPSHDLELGVSTVAGWTVWQRWERDFRVRASLTGGGYWQDGFGWSPVFASRYEHQHAVSDALSLAYGMGWTTRAYDGKQEQALGFTAAMRWRL